MPENTIKEVATKISALEQAQMYNTDEGLLSYLREKEKQLRRDKEQLRETAK